MFESWITILSKTFADLRSLSSALILVLAVVVSVSPTNSLLKFTFLGMTSSSSKSSASSSASLGIIFVGDFLGPFRILPHLEFSFSALGFKGFWMKLLLRLRDSSSTSFCSSYRTYASYIFHWFAVSEKFTFFIGSVCSFSSYNEKKLLNFV